MRTAICLVLAACYASTKASAEVRGPTDAEVLKLVNAGREEPLDPSHVSLRRIDDAPSVVLVSVFAHDLGGVLDSVIIDGKRRAATDALSLSALVLGKMGWQAATIETRKRLAVSWLRQGVYHDSIVEQATTPREKLRDANKQPFTGSLDAPSVVLDGKKLIVVVWSSGSSPGSMCNPQFGLVAHARSRFEFSPSGRVIHDDQHVDVLYKPCPGKTGWE